MKPGREDVERGLGDATVFRTTHWSEIMAARQPDGERAARAMASLCQTYWPPLYAFIRRKGHDEETAKDLTQEFFARVLAKDYFRRADPQRGKFRTFLLSALTHFLANEWHRDHCQKRGNGQPTISLDGEMAEFDGGQELSHDMTPERLFDRRWAETLLGRVLAQLRREYGVAGRGRLFERLRPYLDGAESLESYGTLASSEGLEPGAVKVQVHRMRRRFGELLRQEVARTVSHPGEIDGELRHLLAAVAD